MNLKDKNRMYKVVTFIYFLLLFIQKALKKFGLITKSVSTIIVSILFIMLIIAIEVIRFDLIKKLKIRLNKRNKKS